MKKALTMFLILLIIFSYTPAYAQSINTRPPSISSGYAIVMDSQSGRVLYQKNIDKLVPMASTTKIMTSIIALENSNLNDIVVVSKKASSIHGSTVGLKEGEQVTVEELLYGLMLQSGNDCAIAIAEHIGGSVEGFAAMMDSKAFDIGAFNTGFRTPHGLDADGHFTTVYDLALITRYALNNEVFAKIVSTRDITFERNGKRRAFHNINKMLWKMEGADGVKTGYTGKAGKCLVSSALRNNRRYICVVLNSPNRWEDSKKLLEYSFDNYNEAFNIDLKSNFYNIPVKAGKKAEVKAVCDVNITIPLTREEKESLSYKVILPESVPAPIYSGQQVGRIELYSGDKEIYSLPCKTLYNVDKSETKSYFKSIFHKNESD